VLPVARPRRPLSNREVADALREMSLFLEMEDVPFKPRAYEKAALAVDALARPLHEIEAESGEPGIDALPAIGKGIAERIVELLRTGRMRELEQLREKTPIDVRGLTARAAPRRSSTRRCASPSCRRSYARTPARSRRRATARCPA
jgi:DNA polymerase (family 10)